MIIENLVTHNIGINSSDCCCAALGILIQLNELQVILLDKEHYVFRRDVGRQEVSVRRAQRNLNLGEIFFVVYSGFQTCVVYNSDKLRQRNTFRGVIEQNRLLRCVRHVAHELLSGVDSDEATHAVHD